MPQCISYVLLSMVFLLLGNSFKERVCGLIADSMFNLIHFETVQSLDSVFTLQDLSQKGPLFTI